jgi:hypothetical protein
MSSETSNRSLIMLMTSMSVNREQMQNQQRATNLLQARKIKYELIDGADPTEKDRYVASTHAQSLSFCTPNSHVAFTAIAEMPCLN